MAKVRVNVPKSLRVRVAKQLDKLVKSPVLLEQVKDFSVDRIVSLARQGKSMQGTKTTRLLPKLSKSYREMREGNVYFRTVNGRVIPFEGEDPDLDTDPDFFKPTAARSNWTFSGQFLKSVKGKQLRSKRWRGTIEVFATGRRKDGNKNTKIYEWLTALNKSYAIFAMNQSGQKQIRKIAVRFLRKRLKNKIK